MVFGHLEGQLVVTEHVVHVEIVVADEVRGEVVDDDTEAEPAAPRGRHVDDVDVFIRRSDGLAPLLERLGPM